MPNFTPEDNTEFLFTSQIKKFSLSFRMDGMLAIFMNANFQAQKMISKENP